MRLRSYLGIGGGLAAGAVLLWAGVALGGMDKAKDQEKDVRVLTKSKMKVVTVGDDGKRHEKVWVYDDDNEGGGWLGVQIERAGGEAKEADGARVKHVIEDSPAERAGFEDGDIIISVDGDEVQGVGGLTHKIRESEPGAKVRVEVLRNGARKTLSAELGERPASWGALVDSGDAEAWAHGFDTEGFAEGMEDLKESLENMDWGALQGHAFFGGHRPKLGVQLVETTPELREHMGAPAEAGVLVSKVLAGSPAEQAGVRVGDLITGFEGEPVEDAGDLIRGLEDKSGEGVRLDVVRDRKSLTLSVSLPDEEDKEGEGEIRRRRPRAWRDDPNVERLVEQALGAARDQLESTHEARRAALLAVRDSRAAVQDAVRTAMAARRTAARATRNLDATY